MKLNKTILSHGLTALVAMSVTAGVSPSVSKRAISFKTAWERKDPGLIVDRWEARDLVIVNHGNLLYSIFADEEISQEVLNLYLENLEELDKLEGLK